MHLLQTAKCGQNAQATTRLALEGTRVVYDPAESPRETVELEKDSWGAFYTRAYFSDPPFRKSISCCNELPPPRPFDNSALVQTLCVTNRQIYTGIPSLMTVKSPLLRSGVCAARERKRWRFHPLVAKEYDLRIRPADQLSQQGRTCADMRCNF